MKNPLNFDGTDGNFFVTALEDAVKEACPRSNYHAVKSGMDKIYSKVGFFDIACLYLSSDRVHRPVRTLVTGLPASLAQS